MFKKQQITKSFVWYSASDVECVKNIYPVFSLMFIVFIYNYAYISPRKITVYEVGYLCCKISMNISLKSTASCYLL